MGAGGSDSASKIARGVQHSSAGRWEAAERQRLQKLHQLQNKREELANVRRHLKEAIARGDSLEEVKVLQGSVARLEGEMFQLESELAEIESALEKIVALIRSMFGETAAHIFTDTRSRAMRIAGTDVKRLLSGEMTDADEMQAVVERNPELISLIKTSVSSFLEGPFLSQVDVPDIVMHKEWGWFSMKGITLGKLTIQPEAIQISIGGGVVSVHLTEISTQLEPFDWHYDKDKKFPKMQDDGKALVKIEGLSLDVRFKVHVEESSHDMSVRDLQGEATMKSWPRRLRLEAPSRRPTCTTSCFPRSLSRSRA